MNDNPLISVVIPVYKVEQYLDECIESVTGQTYRNLEIILVDDGSPDNCPAMCDEWTRKDRRIRVIHKTNGGLSSARNAGIESATGEYISFIDSDDYVQNIYFEQLYSTMKASGADISCCLYTVDVKKLGSSIINDFRTVTPTQAVKEALAVLGVERSACMKLYKTSIFTAGEGIRYTVGIISEDLAAMPAVFSAAKSLAFVENSLYFYRLQEDSIMHTTYKSSHEEYYTSYRIAEESAKKNFPDQWPELSRYFRYDYIQNTMKMIRDVCLSPDSPGRSEVLSDLTKRITKRDAISFMFSYAGLPKKLAALMTAFMPKLALKIIERSRKFTPAFK